MEFTAVLGETRVIPVVEIPRAEDAVPLAEALRDGGLPCAEITFRTAAAGDAIAAIERRDPDFLVGAGTVLTVAQAKQALAAGARFLVSPAFDPGRGGVRRRAWRAHAPRRVHPHRDRARRWRTASRW